MISKSQDKCLPKGVIAFKTQKSQFADFKILIKLEFFYK